jgi:hypothetical protein
MKKSFIILLGLIGIYSCQWNNRPEFKSKEFSEMFPNFFDTKYTSVIFVNDAGDTLRQEDFSIQIKNCINNSGSKFVKFGPIDYIYFSKKKEKR